MQLDKYAIKERQKTFKDYLEFIFKPAIINADTIYKNYKSVNRFCTQKQYPYKSMFALDTNQEIQALRHDILNEGIRIMGRRKKSEDGRLIILDYYAGYIEKLSAKLDSTSQDQNETSSTGVPTDQITKTAQVSENDIQKAVEGFLNEVRFFRKSRNRKLRDECAKKYGYKCYACGFDFEKNYGERGHLYIQVHHTKPMAEYDDAHEVELDDLCALCANCHCMVHHGKNILDVEKLKTLVDNQKELQE